MRSYNLRTSYARVCLQTHKILFLLKDYERMVAKIIFALTAEITKAGPDLECDIRRFLYPRQKFD